MRKITHNSIYYFLNRINKKIDNTEVKNVDGETHLYLFDNLIAVMDIYGEIFITDAGHVTATTQERLNGFDGVRLQRRNGKWILNNRPWCGKFININSI